MHVGLRAVCVDLPIFQVPFSPVQFTSRHPNEPEAGPISAFVIAGASVFFEYHAP
jgi:hypothetical protein